MLMLCTLSARKLTVVFISAAACLCVDSSAPSGDSYHGNKFPEVSLGASIAEGSEGQRVVNRGRAEQRDCSHLRAF
jgi:hypothetical protein